MRTCNFIYARKKNNVSGAANFMKFANLKKKTFCDEFEKNKKCRIYG